MEIFTMKRTRDCALPASSPLTMWRALPITTGAVRPDAVEGYAAPVAADATATAPGQPAWSPPI